MISVCMCTYGRPELLEEAIECFLRQTRTDSELVILNDRAEQKLYFSHPRVRIYNVDTRYEYTSNKRLETARLAAGDYLCFWDDDDIYLPNHLEECMRKLKYFLNKNISRDALQWIDRGHKLYRIVPSAYVHTLLIHKDVYWSVGGHTADVTRDEDLTFLKKLLKARKLAHQVFRKTKPTFINRVKTGCFRISDYGNFDGFHKERSLAVKEDADKRNQFGDVHLKPQWRGDYVAIADKSWEKYLEVAR